jgi:hypothetical protein
MAYNISPLAYSSVKANMFKGKQDEKRKNISERCLQGVLIPPMHKGGLPLVW